MALNDKALNRFEGWCYVTVVLRTSETKSLLVVSFHDVQDLYNINPINKSLLCSFRIHGLSLRYSSALAQTWLLGLVSMGRPPDRFQRYTTAFGSVSP